MARREFLLFFVCLSALAIGCGSGQEEQFDKASDSFLKAMQAVEQGDSAKAIEALTTSLEILPTVSAYMERAKLYADADKQEEALQDCRAALELSPEDRDAKWLLSEIEKPAAERFKGRNQEPPSSSK